MKNKIIFYLSFVLILFPNISLAVVNLPWSTTYNCADWKQSDGLYNVNCDGLTGHGSWITSDGKEEQITSAANYPGGAGGKGQRHWLGDAPVDNSGGTRIQFTSPQSELWIRWYMLFQTGFQWNVLFEYKAFIVDMGLGPTQTIIGWRWQDGVGIVVNGNPYDSQSGGWNTTMVNGSTDARGNKMSDGQWHLYEVHMKMDTNGNNGIVEYFVDGARWLYRTDVNYGTSAGWSYMVIGDNGGRVANGVPYAYYVDYDDIVISTTGPVGGNTPPPSGNTPPSNNSGGDNSASGGSGCGFVKDDGKGQGAKGEGLSLILLFLLLILLLSKTKYRRLFMKKLIGVFLFGLFLLLSPTISLAAVNLPWSTTYNCADWKQSDGLYPPAINCDGLTGFGNWTCDNGDGTIREEQITSAANYAGGGGGKGQRHWLGDGVNNISGEMRIDWSPTPQNEIWIRWYMRYESGFKWNPLVDNKVLTINPGYVNRTIFGFEWTDQIRIYSNGYNGLYYSAVGDGWKGIMGGDVGDGQWHLYEIHLKMNTNGSDGIAEAWVDGIKRISYTNANYGGSQGAPGWSGIQIASNANSPSNGRCMAVDYDDLMVSTTGPIGGSTPPPSGNNPPPNNSGNDTSASGGSGCGFVKDNDKGQGAKGEGPSFIMMLIITLCLLPIARRLFKAFNRPVL